MQSLSPNLPTVNLEDFVTAVLCHKYSLMPVVAKDPQPKTGVDHIFPLV